MHLGDDLCPFLSNINQVLLFLGVLPSICVLKALFGLGIDSNTAEETNGPWLWRMDARCSQRRNGTYCACSKHHLFFEADNHGFLCYHLKCNACLGQGCHPADHDTKLILSKDLLEVKGTWKKCSLSLGPYCWETVCWLSLGLLSIQPSTEVWL